MVKLIVWVSVSSKTDTKVKGNAESTYRTGNVNLTPANIGAIPSTDSKTSFSGNSNFSTLSGYVHKNGKTILMRLAGDGINVTSEGWKTVATIPSGYRPAYDIEFPAFVWGDMADGTVQTSGNVNIYLKAAQNQRVSARDVIWFIA